MLDDEPFPPPHPAFAAHFTDPLYEDEGEDLAPFGSDEGWDMLREWLERQGELNSASTIAQVLEIERGAEEAEFGTLEGLDGVEPATFFSSAAFLVLRLTGQLDDADRALALRALDLLNAHVGGSPVIDRQIDDLRSWRNPDRP